MEYIKWGERNGYQNKPTCRGRERWWDLGIIDYNIAYPSTHNPAWAMFLNKYTYYMDKVFYGIKAKNSELLWGFMNSSLALFQAEFFGYSLVGGGGSFITVEDLKQLLVLHTDKLIPFSCYLSKREYKPIFTEKVINRKILDSYINNL